MVCVGARNYEFGKSLLSSCGCCINDIRILNIMVFHIHYPCVRLEPLSSRKNRVQGCKWLKHTRLKMKGMILELAVCFGSQSVLRSSWLPSFHFERGWLIPSHHSLTLLPRQVWIYVLPQVNKSKLILRCIRRHSSHLTPVWYPEPITIYYRLRKGRA